MKPAKSSANRCYRSATTRRSPPRLPGGWHDRSAALDRARRWPPRWAPRRRARCRCPFRASRSTRARSRPAKRSSPSRATTATATTSCAAALAAGAGLAVVAADRRGRFPDARAAARRSRCARWACATSRARRARARRRRSSPSPAPSARPAPRRRCAWRSPRDGETHASVASYNNHWGVPLSLARCPATARYAVFEIGMNHAGEIEPLTRLVRPHVAIVTTVEPVHLEFFRSVEAIADAKAEIFLGLEPGGAAVHQSRQSAVRAPRARRAGRRRRAHRRLRRARGRGCAADQMRAASRRLDRRGADPRHRRHLQARRARPPSGAQLACGARGDACWSAPILRSRRSRSPSCSRRAGAARASPSKCRAARRS